MDRGQLGEPCHKQPFLAVVPKSLRLASCGLLQVVSGPTFQISLRATVIMPSLCMSSDNLEFSAVQCGQCQMETIQFHNQLQVPCEWFATSNEQTKKVSSSWQQHCAVLFPFGAAGFCPALSIELADSTEGRGHSRSFIFRNQLVYC